MQHRLTEIGIFPGGDRISSRDASLCIDNR